MEFVYVVRRKDLFDRTFPHGFRPTGSEEEPEEHSLADLIREEGYFVEREFAEEQPDLQQIIPYVIVYKEGKILQVERLTNQTEERLHELLSIGIGGHINPEDANGDLLDRAVKRELEEELKIDGDYRLTQVGILNDDTNPVGAVHFGLVYRMDLTRGQVQIRETDKMEGTFLPVDEVRTKNKEEPEMFESWSRLLLNRIDAALPK